MDLAQVYFDELLPQIESDYDSIDVDVTIYTWKEPTKETKNEYTCHWVSNGWKDTDLNNKTQSEMIAILDTALSEDNIFEVNCYIMEVV